MFPLIPIKIQFAWKKNAYKNIFLWIEAQNFNENIYMYNNNQYLKLFDLRSK